MTYDPAKHHRRSIRLAGYDYRNVGGYFVTICTAEKRRVFGSILNQRMHLHPYGRMVEECWCAIPEHFEHVAIDSYVVMPNHFHGILMMKDIGAQHAASGNSSTPALSTIIRSFKSAVSRAVNSSRESKGLSKVTVWQRNYYERIVRDETELNEIQRYIIENPLNWEQDENYRN